MYDAKVIEYHAVAVALQKWAKELFEVEFFNAEVVENVRDTIDNIANDTAYLRDVVAAIEEIALDLPADE